MSDLIEYQGKKLHRQKIDGVWYYAICDILHIITDEQDVHAYWKKLKKALEVEGFSDIYYIIEPLEFDGEKHEGVSKQVVFRIVQSVHNPKAEEFKQWIANLAQAELEEYINPALAIERARMRYREMGYSTKWIDSRIKCAGIRNVLVSEWANRGVEVDDYLNLTDTINKATFDMSIGEYKEYKGINPEDSLRDNMTQMELLITALGELTTAELHKANDSQGFDELNRDAIEGGRTAREAKKPIEATLGKPVASRINAKEIIEEEKKLLGE